MDTRLFISETSGVTGAEVNLYDDVSTNITFNIADIRDPQNRNTSWSKTITIPGSKANNKIFEHIFECDISGGFNPNLKAYAQVTADTIEVFNGIVQLLKINTLQDNRIEYEIALKGVTGTLFSSMGDRYLTDLDLSGYNHIPTKANQVTSWSATVGSGYVYPLIDNGLQDVTAVVPIFDSAKMYPCIYAKTLVDQIFAENGFTYTSNFLTSDTFKRIIVSSNKGFPNQQLTVSGSFALEASIASNGDTFTTVAYIKHYKAAENSTFYYQLASFGFSFDVQSATLTFSKVINVNQFDLISIAFYVASGSTGSFAVKSGASFNGAYALNNEIGTSDFQVTKSGDQSINNTVGYTTITYTVEVSDPGNTFQSSTHYVPVINFQYTLAEKIKQRDFLTSIFKLFNLYVWENKAIQNNLYIEPRNDFYLSGSVTDWSQKLDRSKPFELVPMGELDFKTLRMTYKDDSDFFNTKYKGDHNLIYGEEVLEVTNDFISATKVIDVIFANTPIVSYPNSSMVFPTIVKDDLQNQNDFFGGAIRLFYYGGLKTSDSTWIHRASLNGSFSDTTYTTYPYCGHVDDPYSSTLDLCFDSPEEVYYPVTVTSYTDNNLYNAYYSQMMTEITDPDSKIVTGYFYLTPLDILKLTFRYLYQVDYHFLRLLKVIDYDPKRWVTKCEFIKVKDAVPFTASHRNRSQLVINHTTGGVIDVIAGVQVINGVIVDGDTNLMGTTGIIGGNIDVNTTTGKASTGAKIIHGGIAKL